ncbi:hypothetical protein D9M70_399390 [compost metagenome]
MMGYSCATKSSGLSSIMTGHSVTAEPKKASSTRGICRTVTKSLHNPTPEYAELGSGAEREPCPTPAEDEQTLKAKCAL